MRQICLILLLFAFNLEAKKTVCLNMIVKDESPVIERCLSSVKPLIDYWLIVDTGSTDGTQEIIRRNMKGIPGELHERPWKNFAYNRNEALNLAKNKADYVLFIDADEKLEFDKEFTLPGLDKDYYHIKIRQNNTDCLRVFLIKSLLNWHWKGVIHEELVCNEARNYAILDGVVDVASFQDGHRSQDPLKLKKDIQVLKDAIQDEPENGRYVTFLAQSYLSDNQPDLALKWFQKRASMNAGSKEEIFYALYQIGHLQELMQAPCETVIESYNKAFQYRPSRAEPLFCLARYMYFKNNFSLSYILSKHALSIPQPSDTIYVNSQIYEYMIPFLVANSAVQLGKYQEGIDLYRKLLCVSTLPEPVKKEIVENLYKISQIQN